jgi:hypothetical protein
MPTGRATWCGSTAAHRGDRQHRRRGPDRACDALAYADARLDPDVLIDVATLTGAATLGLGKRHAALFTADDALARALTVASTASGERIWRMPLIDYTPALRTVADLRHVPLDAVIGGGRSRRLCSCAPSPATTLAQLTSPARPGRTGRARVQGSDRTEPAAALAGVPTLRPMSMYGLSVLVVESARRRSPRSCGLRRRVTGPLPGWRVCGSRRGWCRGGFEAPTHSVRPPPGRPAAVRRGPPTAPGAR